MLLFLIRDWSYSYEFPYGFVGGQNFLLKRINVSLKGLTIKINIKLDCL
jgi:hypothetical protein